MAKKIVLILLLIIALAAGAFSAFWFFKTSQIEKGLSSFSSVKSKVLIGGYKISGFPLNQEIELRNVTIKSFEKVIGKGKVNFDKIILSASIFDNKFTSSLVNIATFINSKNEKNNIEFNSPPKINIDFSNSNISNISYVDSGYAVYDKDKNLISSSKANNIKFTSSTSQNNQITSRLQMKISSSTSLDFAKIYKDNYESSIIDGIKTGKITIQPSEEELDAETESAEAKVREKELGEITENLEQNFQKLAQIPKVENNAATMVVKPQNKTSSKQISEEGNNQQVKEAAATKADNSSDTLDATPKKQVQAVDIATNNGEKSADKTAVDSIPVENNIPDFASSANDDLNQQNAESSPQSDKPGLAKPIDAKTPELITNDVANTNKVKNFESEARFDITIDIEKIMTPKSSGNEDINSDPTKIVQISREYTTSYKINKLSISNENFSIAINGLVKDLKDDANISGSTTIKIDKSNNFIKFVQGLIKKLNSGSATEIKSFDLSYQDASVEFAYNRFLDSLSDNVQSILEEVALKNQLSQDDAMVFDVRREKNLDFVINETPIREIVGKF